MIKRDSPPMYEQVLFSKYIESYDGTKIAIDCYLPANDEKEIARNIPAIVISRRDQRRVWNADNTVERFVPLVGYGYALVIVELRGCGVSFGIDNSFGSKEQCEDLASVSEWIRNQPWSSGVVGMQGGSNRAYYQLCTISRYPNAFDALTISCAVGDMYYNNYPNGVSALPAVSFEPEKKILKSKEAFYRLNTPVDEDKDGEMGYRAYLEDQFPNNHNFFSYLFLANQNRDSGHPEFNNEKVNMTLPPVFRLRNLIGKTSFKQLQFIGQLEPGPLDQLNQFMNYGGNVIMAPWDHIGTIFEKSDYEDGTLDFYSIMKYWFDYSLQKKNNGFDQLPPVIYYMFY